MSDNIAYQPATCTCGGVRSPPGLPNWTDSNQPCHELVYMPPFSLANGLRRLAENQ